MAGGGGGGESGEPEFQIAPMIDVLLVLLCFFVSITTAQVLKVDKNIVLPVSPHAKDRDQEMSKHEVAVNVRWDPAVRRATIIVDDKEFPAMTDLITYLQGRFGADKLLRVVLRGDAKLPAIEIQKVMTAVANGGIADISFAASNR